MQQDDPGVDDEYPFFGEYGVGWLEGGGRKIAFAVFGLVWGVDGPRFWLFITPYWSVISTRSVLVWLRVLFPACLPRVVRFFVVLPLPVSLLWRLFAPIRR